MSQSDKTNRIGYLDIVRGIGILMMLLGHCYTIPEWLMHLIYSVHMPLFFILSGYVFKAPDASLAETSRTESNASAYGTMRAFLGRSARQLLLPYVLSCVVIIIVQVVLALAMHGDVLGTLWQWIWNALYGSGTPEAVLPGFIQASGLPISYIGALWFLLALFTARVLLAVCLRSRTPFVYVMILFFAGLVTPRWIGWLPFSIQAGMGGLLFLYIGYVIRKKDLFHWNAVHWAAKILMLLVWGYCIIFCGRLWMVTNIYSDGMLDVIGAVSGTFVMVWISQLLERWMGRFLRWLSFLGRITLGILCAHTIVLSITDHTQCIADLAIQLSVGYRTAELLIKLAGTAIVAVILYWIPGIGKIWFPGKKRPAGVSGPYAGAG